jgi:hypothetical protein
MNNIWQVQCEKQEIYKIFILQVLDKNPFISISDIKFSKYLVFQDPQQIKQQVINK